MYRNLPMSYRSLGALVLLLAAQGAYSQYQNQNNVVNCSSEDGRRNYCNVDTRGGVRMVRQRSGSPCRQGSTWGYDRNGIWVDRGCRADFAVGRGGGGGNRPGGPGWNNGGGWNNSGQLVNCSSEDGRRNYCSVDTRGGVRMVRQRSGSPCRQGSTWGYDGNGIWVDRGCRADFAVGRGGGGGNRPGRPGGWNGSGQVQTVNCSSEDGRRRHCAVDTRGGVQMIRQRSGSPCREGSTWGYDANGIWVDKGCRADFAVKRGNPLAR